MNRVLIRSEGGFTLVEILVVLIILGILFATFGTKVFSSGEKAKVDMTKIKMQQVKQFIDEYRFRYNKTPDSLSDLYSCNESTGPGCMPIADESDLTDSWDTPLQYSSSGRTYKITSMGADGKVGGDGVNFDVFLEGP